MSNETFALILSIVGSAVGVTWVLRSKMSDMEKTLAAHIAASKQEVKALTMRVVRLEKRKVR